MSKPKSGKRKSESAVQSVAEIPLAIIQAMTLIYQEAEWISTDTAYSVARLDEACEILDSVMIFIAGGDCNLGHLALTSGQQEYLRYVFGQFAAGEEIASEKGEVEKEREACAIIADEAEFGDDSRHRRAKVASEIRDAIRARSFTSPGESELQRCD